MNRKRVLLIQIRDADDPMAVHEAQCVTTRLGADRAELVTRNALIEGADASWPRGFDAVVIGGSGDYGVNDRRSDPWVAGLRHVLDCVLTQQTPTFAICFGHQLLAHHLGSEVATDEQAELGTVSVRLTEAGTSDPLFSTLERAFDVHTGHSDHVTKVPPELELLAEGDTCAHQAFRHRSAPIYSTQFHPDMTGAEAVARYLAYRHHLEREGERPGGVPFRAGADASAALLARFLELVAYDRAG